ncbi:MAG: Signal peptidase [Labilithrix sp.]|nr:Signal peptidase [Labilithrix sp.]
MSKKDGLTPQPPLLEQEKGSTEDDVEADASAKSVTNGVDGSADEADGEDDDQVVSVAERRAGTARAVPRDDRDHTKAPHPPPPKKLLRTAYWALWFVLTPFALACILVWALTPPSGIDHGGALGWIESWVREQPVPVGIVTFTLFEMALWAARHHLPLAYHAHPPLRSDLPKGMRGPFERARALLEEAESILDKHEESIRKELSSKERDKLRVDLDALEDAMEREPFDEEGFVDALVRADGEVDVRLGRWRKSEVREYAESILVAIAVAMALRAFVVEAFKIPSGSMIPTLQVGDHIFVNKFTYGPAIPYTHKRIWSRMPPERGDVIVFAYPEHPDQDFIKRVIATPGDKLEARGGHPIINGWEVPSCYAGSYSYVEGPENGRHEGEIFVEFLEDEAFLTLYDRQSPQTDYQGPYYVKPGEVWVMGDNRNNSHDSRVWWGGQGGGVPYENIKGRALFVWLSVADTMDWSRIFAPVMGRPPGKGPFGVLPTTMKNVEPAIDKCLRARPPLERTRPPPGGQVVR